jgi:hypothetical protein
LAVSLRVRWMSIVPVAWGEKFRRPSGVLGATGLGLKQIRTFSGSSLAPMCLVASSMISVVVVVATASVSAIMGRVSLFSLRTTGSAARVPETSPVIAN